MKTIAALSIVCLFCTILNLTCADEPDIPQEMPYPDGIFPGSTEATVTAILGEPESIIELGTQKIIKYRLAEVLFEEGRLVQGKFISEQQRAKEKAEKQALKNEAIARKDKRRADNLENAIQLRDKKLQDPDFLLDTPENQLRFWRDLKRQCPDLDLSLQVQEAVRDLKEFQKLKIANRIRWLENKAAELEKQANEAEKRVLAAEKKATQAEARLERIKLEASRFSTFNSALYPRNTGPFVGTYVGPNGREAITYDSASGVWRSVQSKLGN